MARLPRLVLPGFPRQVTQHLGRPTRAALAVMLPLMLSGCWLADRYGPTVSFCSGHEFGRLVIDRDSGAFSDSDLMGRVTRCSQTSATCIDAPFLFDQPPRLPGEGESITWAVGPNRFRIVGQAEGNYRMQARGAGAYDYVYSRGRGITEILTYFDSQSETRRLCRGRLRFEDLNGLIAASSNPSLPV